MSIGYACILLGQPDIQLATCRLSNASPETLRKITASNLTALERITDYNIQHSLKLFRISSDIIPFATHPVNTMDWKELYREQLQRIGDKIKASGMRVSMHPGQYTVLNSPIPHVVQNALEELGYHSDFLDALELNTSHKLVLHIGGVYGDKDTAKAAFMNNFYFLPRAVRSRLVLENDDRNFAIDDVLELSEKCSVPAVFDNLHHKLNPPRSYMEECKWITLCGETWQEGDGRQKIHYSQSNPTGVRGAHSHTIHVKSFLEFYEKLPDPQTDIMLEVKDKNLSAQKCRNVCDERLSIHELEQEWARYRYLVLSKSATHYQSIRSLLQGKDKPQALAFYESIEQALAMPPQIDAEIHGAQHIWKILNQAAAGAEKKRFISLCDRYAAGQVQSGSIRRFLFKCAKAQKIPYLLDSYYFYME